uniref:Uncharacterized protein n=1 Tax=Arundo donax TaxID=35708 RepID=A0A0A9B5Y2_ARUDO
MPQMAMSGPAFSISPTIFFPLLIIFSWDHEPNKGNI